MFGRGTEAKLPARIAATLLLVAAMSQPEHAFGAGPDAEQRSRSLFKQAESLANAGSWAEACPLFQAAHDLHGTGGTALRAADCYEKVAKYDRARSICTSTSCTTATQIRTPTA